MQNEKVYSMPPSQYCECGHEIFDGEVIRMRVLRVMPNGKCEVKCRCKRWNAVPLLYSGHNKV